MSNSASAPSWASLGDEDLLTVRALAELLGISKSKLDKARGTGTGPRYVKMGGQIRYLAGDVRAWIGENRRTQVRWALGQEDPPDPAQVLEWLSGHRVG